MNSTPAIDGTAARVLRDCSLFRFFRAEDIDRLLQRCALRTYAAGDAICVRGAVGDEFYLVTRGTVELSIPAVEPPAGAGGAGAGNGFKEVVVRVVQPGAEGFFGEIACLVEGGTRTATARARGECEVVAVPRDEFLLLAQSHPPAAMGLVRHLATRVRHHTDSLARVEPPRALNAAVPRRNPWEWLADLATNWSVHWSFAVANVVIWVVWISLNGATFREEFFTINGLTMVLSLQAIVMATLVLVAEKRAADRDKERSDLEFQWASQSMERLNELNLRLANLERHTGAQPPPHSSSFGPLGY